MYYYYNISYPYIIWSKQKNIYLIKKKWPLKNDHIKIIKKNIKKISNNK